MQRADTGRSYAEGGFHFANEQMNEAGECLSGCPKAVYCPRGREEAGEPIGLCGIGIAEGSSNGALTAARAPPGPLQAQPNAPPPGLDDPERHGRWAPPGGCVGSRL